MGGEDPLACDALERTGSAERNEEKERKPVSVFKLFTDM